MHTAAGPYLLAVDHERLAVSAGGGTQGGQIRAGFRFGKTLHPDFAVEDRGQMPTLLLVGARHQQRRSGVMDPDECQHQSGCVVRRQFLVQNDLLGNRHPAAPLLWPVRNRETRAAQFGEPGFLKRDELLVGDTGLGLPPIGGHMLSTPRTHRGAKLLVGHNVAGSSSAADRPTGSRSGWL